MKLYKINLLTQGSIIKWITLGRENNEIRAKQQWSCERQRPGTSTCLRAAVGMWLCWQWVDMCLSQDGLNAESKQMCSIFSHHSCSLLQIFPQLKVGCFVAGLEGLLCKKLSFTPVTEFMSTEGKSRHSYQCSTKWLYKVHLKVPETMFKICLLPSTRWHFKMFTTQKPLANGHLGKNTQNTTIHSRTSEQVFIIYYGLNASDGTSSFHLNISKPQKQHKVCSSGCSAAQFDF